MWKPLAAILLLCAAAVTWLGYQKHTVEAERDLYRSELATARLKVQQLAEQLTAAYQKSEEYRQQIATITAAYTRASQRITETEERHAHALKALDALQRQNAQLAAWAAADLPTDADGWLRNTLSSAANHHPHRGGTPTAPAGATYPAAEAANASRAASDP